VALLVVVADAEGGVPGTTQAAWQAAPCELHVIMQIVTVDVCASCIFSAAMTPVWLAKIAAPKITTPARASAALDNLNAGMTNCLLAPRLRVTAAAASCTDAIITRRTQDREGGANPPGLAATQAVWM
jgi:hypothetical protein